MSAATDVADILDGAAALVERGWCQNANARDANRDRVYINDPGACAWCASGGIMRAAIDLGWSGETFEFLTTDARAELRAHIDAPVETWNDQDRQTSANVAATIRAAAAAVRRRGFL